MSFINYNKKHDIINVVLDNLPFGLNQSTNKVLVLTRGVGSLFAIISFGSKYSAML